MKSETKKENPRIASLRRVLGEAKASHPDTIEYIKLLLDQGRPVVVFGHHGTVLDILCDRLAKYKPVRLCQKTKTTQKQSIVDAFQNGDTNLFIGGLKSSSVGITLTRSCDVVFVEIDYVPATMNQALDRVHRIGQKNAVTGHYIVSKNKFDRNIVRLMIDKQKSFEKVGL